MRRLVSEFPVKLMEPIDQLAVWDFPANRFKCFLVLRITVSRFLQKINDMHKRHRTRMTMLLACVAISADKLILYRF